MSATQHDTFINALLNTSIQLSVRIFLEEHGDKNVFNEGLFRVLKKFHGKFHCLFFEMLFIKEQRLSLINQSDSISDKFLVQLVIYFDMMLLLLLMNTCFSCIFRTLIPFFLVDHDARERRNVVYFFNVFKHLSNVFLKKVVLQFL